MSVTFYKKLTPDNNKYIYPEKCLMMLLYHTISIMSSYCSAHVYMYNAFLCQKCNE